MEVLLGSVNRIGANRVGPWVVAGNFNEVLFQNEVKGRNMRRKVQMAGFREALQLNGLMDFGSVGAFYTWFNGRRDDRAIWERLDRVVGNEGFKQCFPFFKNEVLVTNHSDDFALILHMDVNMPKFIRRGSTF